MKTKAIILAAGTGSRLGELTKDRPKCMVTYNGKPLIDHILETMDACGIEDIAIVGGYQLETLKDHLKNRHIKFYENKRYDKTNMVESLFCAEPELAGKNVIISYSDIVYKPSILAALEQTPGDLNIVIDKGWRTLWDMRMADPLKDAETLKLDEKGFIRELGKKPASLDDIQGQYIGLFKFSEGSLTHIRKFYRELDRKQIYDGKNFENMFMTSFLQLLIDRLIPARPVFIHGGWCEVDTPEDLKKYEEHRPC